MCRALEGPAATVPGSGSVSTRVAVAGASSLVADVRRKPNRYRCRVPDRFVSGDGGQCGDATVVHFSYDGLAIRSRLACAIGDQIIFQWTSERTLQQNEAQVLWQLEQEGGVLLGCHTSPATACRIAVLNSK